MYYGVRKRIEELTKARKFIARQERVPYNIGHTEIEIDSSAVLKAIDDELTFLQSIIAGDRHGS